MAAQKGQYKLSEDNSLLCTLELNPTLKTYASNFLLYGGILAGHSDGRFDLEELAYLSDALSPLFDSPEELIRGMGSPETAVASLDETMDWLKENGDDVNHDLLRCLTGIVAADHVLRPGELRFIQNISNGLGISSEDGKQILEDAFRAMGH
ncbi:MAG: TerB family tellurite resistance protein [Deltaproteobacteria bacterium]|nr:TerB family tellurite resistance protein [Deltaproteobacteria bacterium]MBN2672340.1 TerB family tellurite resistance protein [Deltaproteobacteria bacterium]